ncbi:hypothetical protein EVAR_61055_1 [Eumeta japonica]|uniref:Uncharacterized protein n=1 Tax=Eumeta variegata TaxID=151549 RepID=A0A4C1Z4E3_EUMVA|nr:hypothetical protein EVAR_61055_1 [Eumeta japonica]
MVKIVAFDTIDTGFDRDRERIDRRVLQLNLLPQRNNHRYYLPRGFWIISQIVVSRASETVLSQRPRTPDVTSVTSGVSPGALLWWKVEWLNANTNPMF